MQQAMNESGRAPQFMPTEYGHLMAPYDFRGVMGAPG